ncbi:uncharacterized protein VTP21DRAFT_1756 [Calcarisporiella thermophila]|uniref:uncharacterized protein n=1 Tax=Calcarisporiella thermophila TaxID=911321 RepID=UPI0037427895
MFILSVLKDTVRIVPSDFSIPKYEALEDEINKKYSNKVLQGVGLCICLYDILEASEGFIFHSDGSSHVKVRFRMLVFRPHIGEVLTGKVKSCTSSGVRVTMDFFDDILIPPHYLPTPSEFDMEEQAWQWSFDGNPMWIDVGSNIRFRIEDETFTDTTPPPANRQKTTVAEQEAMNSTKVPPYSLTATIADEGLGDPEWWKGEEPV